MKKKLKIIIAILVIIPLIFLVEAVFVFHVDTPIWDSWRMIPLFEKIYGGGLTFADFWQQHNEHRLFFSRLIILLLGRLTAWNTIYEVLFNVLITIGILLIVYKQLKTDFPQIPWFYVLPVFSILLFSFSQFENWMLGFTLHIFLHQLATVALVWHITQKNLTWKNIFWTTIFAVITTFSFGSALIIWPSVLLFLIINKNLKFAVKQKMVVFWLIISLFIIISYLHNFQANTQEFWLTMFRNPIDVLMFTLLFLGRPMSIFLYLDTFWGVIVTLYALMLTIGMLITLINKRYLITQQISAIIFYIIFTLGTAFVIALGRAQFGYEAARASRYITVANLFWIGIFTIWFIFYYFLRIRSKNIKYLPNSVRFLPVIFALYVMMLLLSSFKSMPLFQLLSIRYQKERDNILNYANGGNLEVFSYSEDFLKENIEVLKKYKLSVFRNY